jgi:HEAT repeat protein
VDERIQGLLESGDPDERLQGLRVVALYEDQDAVETARRLLAQDKEPEVREHAARALGVTAGARALESLLRAARADADAMVRRTALAVLGEIGERDVARALAALVDQLDAHDQATAIDALRASGAREALPILVELARAESSHVRALALHAFLTLGGAANTALPSEIERVAKEVDERGPLWALPAAALVPDGPRLTALAERLEREHTTRADRETIAYRALELPPPARLETLQLLVAFAERTGERDAGLVAARELARAGSALGARILASVLYDPTARGRVQAALALAELGAPLGEPFLLRRIGSGSEHGSVARALALLGRPEGVRALGALLSSDFPAERRLAALGFAALGRADGAAELVRTLDYPLQSERVEALRAARELWAEGPAIDPLASAAERRPSVESYAAHFARRES